MDGEETVKAAMISTEIRTEWKTFRQLLVKQPQDTTASQLKELVSNDMLKAMFPNLNKIASIGLTIPVSTASVERSFSQMKMIKTRLRNSLSDCSVSHLMRIAIEAPEVLPESDLEEIVDVWQKYLEIQGGARITQGGRMPPLSYPPPAPHPLNTPLGYEWMCV